jgi:hypothetical protein
MLEIGLCRGLVAIAWLERLHVRGVRKYVCVCEMGVKQSLKHNPGQQSCQLDNVWNL